MKYLKRRIKYIYNNWANDKFIYQKDNTGTYKKITYKEFIEKSLGFAKYLIDKGYKNKNIILLSENSISLMSLDLAISFYVGKSAIVCKEWTKKDILDSISEIDASLIIYSNNYKKIVKDISIASICMDDIKCKFDKKLLDLDIKKENEVAKIVFSSGTTGKSKGVQLSIKNIYSGLNSLQKRCHLTHDDYAYMFLPLHHTYASICHFFYALYTGHRLYLSSSTSNIGKELLEVNPTVFCCVPIVLMKLYDSYKDNIDKAFGTNIRLIICGGAPLNKEIRKKFKDKNLCLMQTYALTEVSSSFTLAYPYKDDLESAGEIYEDIDVKIVDEDKEGIGEIIVKGDNVFKGYTDEKLNKLVFDSNGYFHTGDLGYIKDKKLFIKGRKKKILLTSNGENIDAESIENTIKNSSNSIKSAKAYIKNDTLAINLYVSNTDEDYNKIIEEYNKNVPIYEKIKSLEVYEDSVDSRLKQ